MQISNTPPTQSSLERSSTVVKSVWRLRLPLFMNRSQINSSRSSRPSIHELRTNPILKCEDSSPRLQLNVRRRSSRMLWVKEQRSSLVRNRLKRRETSSNLGCWGESRTRWGSTRRRCSHLPSLSLLSRLMRKLLILQMTTIVSFPFSFPLFFHSSTSRHLISLPSTSPLNHDTETDHRSLWFS